MNTPDRIIPGTVPSATRSYCYLQSPTAALFRKLFPLISRSGTTPLPKAGGAVNEEVALVLPTGEVLWAVSYKGDLEGWRRKVIECAEERELLWGEIADDQLRISDGRTVPLDSCRVESGDS